MSPVNPIKNLPGTPEEKAELAVKMYNQLAEKHNALQSQVEWLIRQMHGVKSEKLHLHNPDQMVMDDLLEPKSEAKQAPIEEETKTGANGENKPKQPGHARAPFPENWERVKVYIDIDKSLKEEYGEENLTKIEEVVSEHMEYKRKVYVKQIIRIKYIRRDQVGNERFVIPELPPRPIDKSIAGTSLLVYIIVSKFVDHLPLYRLSKQFGRDGIKITESTMSGWLKQLYQLLLPVYLAMCDHLKQGEIVNTDDTKLPVVVGDLKHKTHKGYVWVYISNGMVVYEYKKTRNRQGPFEFLSGFEGKYLQADACPSYDLAINTFRLIEVGCWAHARRKFFDAINEEPVDAQRMVMTIDKLYDIERHIKTEKYSPSETQAYREEHSTKTIDDIQEQLEDIRNRKIPVTPGSYLGKALTYATNQWTALNEYIKNGNLNIDNNVSERFMKYVVMGRKNYLFCGSHDAAQRNALFYSFTGTCKFLGINPTEYLVDTLNRLAAKEGPENLVPTEWLKQKSADNP